MINLIKSELYRLFRSKTYKNCIMGSLGVTIFVLFLAIFTDVELWIMLSTGQDGLRRGFLIGLHEGASFRELIVNALGSGAGLYIICIILTTSVMVSKYRCGIMKNTVSYGYERWKIYVSQMASMIVTISLLVICNVLTVLLITGFAFRVTNINYEGIMLLFKALILYITIVSATISIYTFFATIISNSEVMATVVIIEIIGVAMMIEPYFPTKIINLLPYSMIRTVAQLPENMSFWMYLINSLVIIVIATSLGILTFNKKEIK